MTRLKKFLKRWPLISAVIFNIFTWIFFIYALNSNKYIFLLFTLVILIPGRWILEEGEGLTKSKRAIIYITYFIMSIVSIFTCNDIIK